MLGLESKRVRLASDHANWAADFDRERQSILDVLSGQVEHIGSTSIPGVPAKPILDILIGVDDFEAARAFVREMESLGYEFRGEYGIARRHYFVKGTPRTHHVHMVERGSEMWTVTLRFRDALRADTTLAAEYAERKSALAGQHAENREAYQAAKDRVVEELLTRIVR
jgi:GrpB-like predicted nucleotidyltransferase (UPF0157 family)